MAFNITEKSSRRIKESYGTTSALTIVPPSPAPVDLSGYPLKVDVDASLYNLGVKNANQDTSIFNLGVKNAYQDTSIFNLGVKNAYQDTSIFNLGVKNAYQDTSIFNLNSSLNTLWFGNTTLTGIKTFSGEIRASDGIQSTNYVPGFFPTGAGFRIDSSGKASFQQLIVSDLLAEKTRAFFGKVIISRANGKVKQGLFFDPVKYKYVFNTERDIQYFQQGDLIRAELNSAGAGNYLYEWTVNDAADASVWIEEYIQYDASRFFNDVNVNNGNFSSFTGGVPFYTATMSGSTNYCQSNYMDISAGTLQVWTQTALMSAPGPLCDITLVDYFGNYYADVALNVTTNIQTAILTIPSDVSLRVRYTMKNGGAGVQWGVFKPDASNAWVVQAEDAPNVEGVDFVQVGNSITGASFILYDPAGPRSTFYDKVYTFNPTAANIVSDVGYDGSIFRNFTKGTIIALDGSIGGFVNDGSSLYRNGPTYAQSVGMAPYDYPFYAGQTYANRFNAPFRVKANGDVSMGSWNIDSSGIYNGSKHTADGFSTSGFTLAYNGALHTPRFYLNSNGAVGIRSNTTGKRFELNSTDNNILLYNSSNQVVVKIDDTIFGGAYTGGGIELSGFSDTLKNQIASNGFVVKRSGTSKIECYFDEDTTDKTVFILKDLPTSPSGLPSGAVWRNGTVLNIVA